MKSTTIIAWLLACLVAGGVGFLIGLGQAQQSGGRARQLESEVAALRERLERLETPERFDIEANERQAVAAVRGILTAAMVYMAEFGDQYPESLEAMGPNGMKAIDEALATGRRHGYRFSYMPQVKNQRAVSFLIEARPERYGQSGRRSFRADDSGLIRFTLEDRAATAQDPAL